MASTTDKSEQLKELERAYNKAWMAGIGLEKNKENILFLVDTAQGILNHACVLMYNNKPEGEFYLTEGIGKLQHDLISNVNNMLRSVVIDLKENQE